MTLPVAQRSLAPRLMLGLLQGFAVWFLHDRSTGGQWPSTDPEVFRSLLFVALFAPVFVIASIDSLRRRTLAIWTTTAVILLAGLGFYAGYREPPGSVGATAWFYWPHIYDTAFFLVILLFVGLALVVAGDIDRRVIAQYRTYFRVFWRNVAQFILAALFVGLFWAILWQGGELFSIVGLQFFSQTIAKDWFWIPATALASSVALHFADVTIRTLPAVRSRVPGVLAWLLPLLVLIGGGFLGALPFSGLEPLWKSRYAAFSLLTASATLILLINIHFQDGGPETNRTPMLLYGRMIASLMLVPLTVLAMIALGLRVDQHGWTPGRITAAVATGISAGYALGYAASALRSGTHLSALPTINVGMSFVIVAVIALLMSPIADPARLAVSNQVQRLQTGKVSAETFDYDLLQRKGLRYGAEALKRLTNSKEGPGAARIAASAARALERGTAAHPRPVLLPATPATRATNITMLRPQSDKLPSDFLEQDWSRQKNDPRIPRCLTVAPSPCDGILIDLTGSEGRDILLFNGGAATVFTRNDQGRWALAGQINNLFCSGTREALRTDKFATVPPRYKDIEANGVRLQVTTFCP